MNRKTGEELVRRFEKAILAHERSRRDALQRQLVEQEREVDHARKDLIEVCDFSLSTEV